MIDLFVVLLPIVAADAINPVLAAAVIFALGTPTPYRAAFWVLAGWFVVYFIAGIGIALGLQQVTAFLANPRAIDFVIQVPIALALLWFAYTTARTGENPRTSQEIPQQSSSHTLGAFSGFILGGTINAVGLPFALPYFAAVDQILKADLSVSEALMVLAVYNTVYILPFALFGVLRFVYRDDADALFERINGWMEKASAVIMPVLLFLIGAVLLIDAAVYFTTGEPWINISPPAD